jgi:DNA-binding transcriptional LysR family regulator
MMHKMHHMGGAVLRELKYASAVARYQSYRKAAQVLGMSQSQLTRIIQALERDLGLTLFHRDRNGAAITAEGAAVLAEASALLQSEERFQARVASIRSVTKKQIRLAVGAIVAQTWLPTAIARLAQKHPLVSISVREVDWWKLAELVSGDEFDIILGECSEAEQNPDVVVHHFPDRPACFFVRESHELAGRSRVSLGDIARFALVAPRLPARIVKQFPAIGKHGQLSSDGRYMLPAIEAPGLRAILDIILGSNAIGMSLPEFCREEIERGTLVELPLRAPWLCIHQGIMLPRGREVSPALRAFIGIAKSAERNYFTPNLK